MMNDLRYMKKICVFVLVAAAVLWGLSPASAEGGPRAVAGKENHDFGTAYAGSEVFHTFVIENAGDEELLIKSIRTG